MEKPREKIKDLVEVKRYDSISNFWIDPAQTLEGYHFTDGLSELMSKWLAAASGSAGSGSCRAIAGYRGVGKSHFVAVLAALMSTPELRIKVTDQQVSNGVQQLLRRHYPVVHVRRGTQPTLFAELIDAVTEQFDASASVIGNDIGEVLQFARSRAGDLPLTVVVDTAADRAGSVQRNDGAALAEMAAVAKSSGIFLGVALDDDIAGADGDNVAISASFEIDYLDQEHLHRAVNARVFLKEGRKLDEIRRIYDSIRQTVTGFRWSEQRFSSLYPLHPVILEITPFVRRYFASFSILNFASLSGEKILSRPADSLLGLDELFETAETELRKNDQLNSTFKYYDEVQESVIEKLPTIERLKVRLVLKALLLLSLDGTGTTAKEVGAALMLPEASSNRSDEIERILESFAMATEGITVDSSNLNEKIFVLSTGYDKHTEELRRWVSKQPESSIESAYVWALKQFYAEFEAAREQAYGRNAVMLPLEWRGTSRRGLLLFGTADGSVPEIGSKADAEWETYFGIDMAGMAFEPNTTPACIAWRTEELNPEDRNVLLGALALATDPEIRTGLGDKLATAEHAHMAAVRRMIERSILENASLHIEGFDYNFSEEARNESNLTGMLSVMLEPVFEIRYPDHPRFDELLTEEHVNLLVKTAFAGSEELAGDAASLGNKFLVPIGLAIDDDGVYRRANKEELLALPHVSSICEIVEKAANSTIQISEIDAKLSNAPFGFGREVRQLVLAAMTSSGLVEIISEGGNRINGRSLDLKIEWARVTGIAAPREGVASHETIVKWAQALTGSTEITNLNSSDDRSRIIEALVDVANGFEIAKKQNHSDPWYEFTNDTRVWRHSNRVSEKFELVIEPVNEALVGSIDLEACLSQFSTAFGDRTDIYEQARQSASKLEVSSKFRAEVERAKEYIGRVGFTGEDNIERAKRELAEIFGAFSEDGSEQTARMVRNSFEKFKRMYIENYVVEHGQRASQFGGRKYQVALLSPEDAKKLAECFQDKTLREKYESKLREVRRRADAFVCKLDPIEYLESGPHCVCSFQLGESDEVQSTRTEFELLLAEIFTEFTTSE